MASEFKSEDYLFCYDWLSLSMLVLNSKDRQGNLWFPLKNASTKQPCNKTFLYNAAIKSIILCSHWADTSKTINNSTIE